MKHVHLTRIALVKYCDKFRYLGENVEQPRRGPNLDLASTIGLDYVKCRQTDGLLCKPNFPII